MRTFDHLVEPVESESDGAPRTSPLPVVVEHVGWSHEDIVRDRFDASTGRVHEVIVETRDVSVPRRRARTHLEYGIRRCQSVTD
jgi:hypothetical protein